MRIEVFLDSAASAAALRNDVVTGLTASPKTLSPTWFYDARGCELYDAITKLAEYYPFRAEREILSTRAKDIVLAAQPDTLVELGSGNSEKSRLLLDAMVMPATYVPFDVAEATLRDTAAALVEEYPGLDIHGIVGDFGHDLVHLPTGGRRMIALLGSTIGNLDPAGRAAMLATLRNGMAAGDTFLLGTDLVKDRARLVAAYDDAAGVTAAFNVNVLSHLNRELHANFDVDGFVHRAVFDEEHQWIEMHLVSRRDQSVRIADVDLDVSFAEGEALRTEISSKFTPGGVAEELRNAGLSVVDQWTDDAGDFLLTLAGVDG
ncbi:MAG TPA: L-histidine N(alpha)-methyltransferase [Acidimicrobiales bacterium]|nr:L-histidine N(alpha)-methyltransferase [Acidimicrobiales bacterium]